MEPPTLLSSNINSRSTAIKTILLSSWRSKLSDEEWENRIRKILPKGVNGDVYDLADCLLKQALVGPIPNQLFISYLKHAVKCELVSHGAVLSSIAKQSTYHQKQTTTLNSNQHHSSTNQTQQSTLNRTSPIICLLEFLRSFRERIACKANEIECLNLCHSLCQLLHWLLKCILNFIEFVTTILPLTANTPTTNISNTGSNANLQANTYNTNTIMNPSGVNNSQNSQTLMISPIFEQIIRIMDMCTENINYLIDKPFMKSLLFIAKIEYEKEFEEIFKTVYIIQQNLNNNSNLHPIKERLGYFEVLQKLINHFNSRDMHPSVLAAQQLKCLQQHKIRFGSNSKIEKKIQQTLLTHDSTTNYALFNSLYPLIACDAILHAARPHKLLAKQIAMITKFNSAPIYMTYCEVIRICMIGFIDSFGHAAKVKWAFFTFLKMPKLLIELCKLSQVSDNIDHNFLKPLHTPSQASNFINDLNSAFERLCEYSPLLDEAEHKCNCDFFKCIIKELIKNEPNLAQELKSFDLRKYSSKRISINNIDPNNSGVGGDMLLKTESVVTTILQTLDSNLNQDLAELFSIISQLVSGKQFEFTLNAAASTGRLQLFIKRLLDHNELNKISRSENPVKSSLIFDITFLILTYIAQQYGPEVIDYDNMEKGTTFKKWFYDCHNPSTRINCPKEMIKTFDPDIVTSLINQILRTEENGGGIKMTSVNWHDVCFNLPKVMTEIFNAWNQGKLDDEDIDLVFEVIKSKMCFAAVVTASWLQCYIKKLNESDRIKPLALLQSLTKASTQARQQNDSSSKWHYGERSSLMCSIVRKIYFEFAPKSTAQSTSNQLSTTNNGTTSSSSSTSLNISSENNNNNNIDDNTSKDETSYYSINDRFISNLTAQEIFLSNVKLCLVKGWIDHKSLVSMNSLFKMIGSECWTNLIVEQILTSHESPSDLNRAVNITYGLFHFDIEACAFALLKEVLPSWLMGEKKQLLLNQPRALALAHLTVMSIIEVYSSLKYDQSHAMRKNSNAQNEEKKARTNQALASNGIKQETSKQTQLNNSTDPNKMNNELNREAKRIKLSNQNHPDNLNNQNLNDINDRLSKLDNCISDLMRLFKEIMSDPVMSQRTLFPVLFLQQTVICTRERSTVITSHLQPEILLDVINLFSSELTFELVLAISNLSTTNSRRYAAKAMCQLAHIKDLKQQSTFTEIVDFSQNNPSSSKLSHQRNAGNIIAGGGLARQLMPAQLQC